MKDIQLNTVENMLTKCSIDGDGDNIIEEIYADSDNDGKIILKTLIKML